MELVAILDELPEVGRSETRSVTIQKSWDGLESGTYVFLELFCNDIDCDCHRAMIQVLDDRGQLRACLSYGWENREFYIDWMGDDQMIDDMPGINLYSLQPQGRDHLKLLELFRKTIEEDPAYAKRIQDHYFLIREVAAGKLKSTFHAEKDPKNYGVDGTSILQ